MKKLKPFRLPYNIPAYCFALFNFILALCFCIVFFHIVHDLPNMIPVHWSEYGGFDKMGNKTELYPIAISSMVIATIALPSTIVLIKKDFVGWSYLFNGISMFSTCLTILVFAFMLTGINNI